MKKLSLHTRNMTLHPTRQEICFQIGDFEVTRREMLFGVIIVIFMVMVGLFINNAITDEIEEQNERYYKAVKITDSGQFQYGLKTSIGNALAYGTVSALDLVSIPEIAGEWFYVKQVKEHYTMHTRIVTETVNGKKVTRTETYWSWDTVESTEHRSNGFRFMNAIFNNTIQGISGKMADSEILLGDVRSWYVYNGEHDRSYFDVIPTSFNATLEIQLKQNSILSWDNKPSITTHYERTIPQIMDSLEAREQTSSIVFWVVWCTLTVGAVVGFCYAENHWLNHNE